MGVPKFYRWISERYPCLSEVVKEYQIPEFDNLYLDMNGIIHVCSHPNDGDPHFRMTEEKMFQDIFHYIEVLFRLIQPKNVFFMAVDGVAPRAKMNQQRGRRFRSAREAVDAEKKARDRGEVLPKEERFDSNCITPGTEFMARLDAQLQYFVSYKISCDKLWQNCKVIYSGHQTPGEGEHKIMEYIRYTKSQDTYNPNTRHCLYGLDADLIMLGLTSHEPHFSLLREEVRFGGKKDNSRTPTPEQTTFHLLHLSLMREYLNYEFMELEHALPFPYDLENIIDDWVLMGFLVGNDFIPHLPHLHINKEALPILYRTYKEVLPTLDGYLNIEGQLHLGRFEKFVKKLAEFEINHFEELNADLKYFNAKRSNDGGAFPVNRGDIGERELEPFDFGDDTLGDENIELDVSETLARLGLNPKSGLSDDEDEDAEENGFSNGSTFEHEFRQHKRDYYMTKMHYEIVDSSVLREQATCYVRGLQWILNYYYNGICSWSWFYPYHYSPFISDLKDFSDMKLDFELEKPFMPYEQLLAVLPPLSVKLLPQAYRPLMIQSESPLKEFYPETFETDLNGKQQDWEAVVLIPFIDEERLLNAMVSCNRKLTEEEKSRNVHGPMYIYSYTPDNLGEYKAPKYFPSIGVNHAACELLHRNDWEILPEKIYKGLCKGVKQDLYFAGFPTLKHVPHKFHVSKDGVKVFQQNSRGENFILDVTEPAVTPDLRDLANQILGKTVFVSWPHLIEAKVHKVSNVSECYILNRGELQKLFIEGSQREEFFTSRNNISSNYHDRWGIDVGKTEILVYATVMTGRQYVPTASGRLSLEKSWSNIIQPYANQLVVKDIDVYDPGYKQHLSPQEYFPPRTKVFMLGQPHYGCMGEVIEIDPSHKGRIRVVMTVAKEPSLESVQQKQEQLITKYLTSYQAAQKLGISSHLLARLTGTVFLVPPSGNNPGMELETKHRLNIGLNLKNNKKNEEVAGYTRKSQEVHGGKSTWLYGEKTIQAVREYQVKFPEIFEHMSVQVGEKDIFFQNEMFGDETYKERVAELTAWLKESDFAKAERRKCGTQALDEVIVLRIVEEVDKAKAVRARAIKMQVRPHLLYKPNPLQGSTPPDHKVAYKLFDRVINCREGYSVPLGAKGTVIGIQPAEKDADVIYDILFDEPFLEGLTFAGPATAKRCYRLHWATMINISYGNRSSSTSGDTEDAYNDTSKHDENRQQAWGNQAKGHQPKWQQQQQRQQQERQGTSPYHGHENKQFQSPPGNRGQGYNHKSSRNSLEFESSSPQPPDPNQLPSPSGLYVSPRKETYQSGYANGGVDTKRGYNYRNQQETPSEIRSASEVDCIVHGTYFASWNKILQHGLSGMSGRLIPCYSCIPREIPVNKSFQLHIHIDVAKALEDGIKFYRINARQVTCSGDRQGILRPIYFSKVVDCMSNSIVFPSQIAGWRDPMPVNPGRPMQNQGHMVKQGQGRGRALSFQQPQGMRLYESIWSQVQQQEREHVDLHPIQSQAVSKMSNTTHVNSSSVSRTGRTEVSVQDLFSQVQNATLRNQSGLNCVSLSNDPIHMHAQDLNEMRETKAESPTKSAFVPTQVIRKQTPRKPRSDQLNEVMNTSHTEEKQTPEANPEKTQGQHMQKQSQQQRSNSDAQPKRKVRNRLAVRFGQPFMEDT